MVTLLITSLFILAFVAIATYFWQKPRRIVEVRALPQPPGRGLFIDGAPGSPSLQAIQAESDSESAAVQRADLIKRAGDGEKATLREANQSEDAGLYAEVLKSFIESADSDLKLLSLVSYVTAHELPVSKRLAEKVIDSYKRAPDRSSTAKTLHIAALSNDAAVYQSAIETAVGFWRNGRLPDVPAPELGSILEGEFWVLSSSTRGSGAGFLLKRALQRARREIEAVHNA